MALKITAIFLLSLLTIVTASPLDKRAVSCDAGNFLAPATSYSPGGCTPCYAFTFAATKGANKCIACPTLPSGFSACSSTTGKPTTCSGGFYSTSSGTACTACTGATYSQPDNTATKCISCGSSLITSCRAIQDPDYGTWTVIATNCTIGAGLEFLPSAAASCVACPAGWYSLGVGGVCRKCTGTFGIVCDPRSGLTTSCLAGSSVSINSTTKAITCPLCASNSFASSSSLASNCTKCLTSTTCDSASGDALVCPASSYIGARNLTATPQVQCVPFVCPVGNRCSGLNGKSMGCLAGWAGAINSTVCNNCNTTRSYTSPNSTVCLGCNSFAATCSPISGDSLTCKTGYIIAARNGTQPIGCNIVCPVGQTLDSTGLGCLDCSLPSNFKVLQCLVPTCSALRLSGVLF